MIMFPNIKNSCFYSVIRYIIICKIITLARPPVILLVEANHDPAIDLA
jgi:hypothetical protein